MSKTMSYFRGPNFFVMKRVFTLLAAMFVLAVTTSTSQAQVKGKELTLKDAVLREWSTFYPERLWSLTWIEGTDKYTYQKRDDDGLFMMVGGPGMKEDQRYFSIDELNKSCGTETKYMPSFHWMEDNVAIFRLGGNVYRWDAASKQGEKLFQYDGEASSIRMNYRSMQMAYTINDNLYVTGKGGKVVPVAVEENEDILFGQTAYRSEFGPAEGIFWSKDGSKIAFNRMDVSQVTDYPIVDVSTDPATVNMIKYPVTGSPNEVVTIGVYDFKSGKTLYLQTGKEDQFLTNVTWGPKGKFIYIAVLNRKMNHLKMNKYDAATGSFVSTLFEEKDEQYVEPKHRMIFLPNSSDEFLWFSERDGYMHLYRYNTSGKLVRQLTKGNWEVKHFHGFDPAGNRALVSGSGEHATETHGYLVDLRKGSHYVVTRTAGTHDVQLSASGKYILDSYSAVDVPRVTQILNVKGKRVSTLLEAANPLEGYQVGQPELIDITGKDGTIFHCSMLKPSNFDSRKKYPVLVYVYGGPRVQIVTNSWQAGMRMWMHWLAEQGYIVFSLDNRGSEYRGLEFEQIVHRQLGTQEVADQLEGVEYLKSLPYVDGNRLAVHGWSFGGFMTTSLMLKAPGTFNVGVAGGAVIDWKWYELMYGEKYMDTPEENPAGYMQASLLNAAEKLQGKLLMVHGTADDVVVPQHHTRFVDACIKAGVHIDLALYPGHGHGVRGKDNFHLMEEMLYYIMEHNQ